MVKLSTRTKSMRKKIASKKALPKAKSPTPAIAHGPVEKPPSPPPPPILQYTVNWEIYWKKKCIKSNTVPSDKFQFSRWLGEVIKIVNTEATKFGHLYKLDKARSTLTSSNKGDSYDLAAETEEDWESLLSVIKIWRDEKRPRITVAIKHFYSPPTTTNADAGSDNDAIDSKPIIIESDDSEEAKSISYSD